MRSFLFVGLAATLASVVSAQAGDWTISFFIGVSGCNTEATTPSFPSNGNGNVQCSTNDTMYAGDNAIMGTESILIQQSGGGAITPHIYSSGGCSGEMLLAAYDPIPGCYNIVGANDGNPNSWGIEQDGA